MKKLNLYCEGFHLIEMLITLGIISILTSASFSTYTHYFMREKRLEAVSTLYNLAIAMEHYHIEHNTYADATLKELHISEYVADNSYQLSIRSANNDAYVLYAKPVGNQLKNDRPCASLILNSLGEKSISGTENVTACW
jgi:type IV pilus assembly protein PilE